jgi:hypothetical protein
MIKPSKRKAERRTPRVGSKCTLLFDTQTPTDNKHPKRTRQSHTDQQGQSETKSTLAFPPPPSPLPPPPPDRRVGKATPDTGEYPRTNKCHIQTHTTNQSAQTHTLPYNGTHHSTGLHNGHSQPTLGRGQERPVPGLRRCWHIDRMHALQHSVACQLPAATTAIHFAQAGCHFMWRRLLGRAHGRVHKTRRTRTSERGPTRHN